MSGLVGLGVAAGRGSHWGRQRGRDPGLYGLRLFGRPGRDRVWAWRFGGHHISLNYLVIDGRLVATTPLLHRCRPGKERAPGKHPVPSSRCRRCRTPTDTDI
ncbi:DUF3500 domain-containing protein [Parafrankia irregularis]|uniref:DUF3500 domain-containing protein n=2 Tax=Parafrankia TaxID=2994362 RepID=UPI001A95FA10